MNDRKVAIFWDYENCSAPTGGSGHQVVKSIRSAIQPYGSIKVFKAYLAISEQSQAKSLTLRSELQASGVSLTDTPHNGRKDVADKMMIVDMLLYAIDNPAPATFVVISGDRDFAYAISVLRLRQYDVVILSPSNAHASLTSHASACLDWRHVLANGHFEAPPISMPSLGYDVFASSSLRTSLTPPVSDMDPPVNEVTLEDYLSDSRRPTTVQPQFGTPSYEHEESRRAAAAAAADITPIAAERTRQWSRVNSVSSTASFGTCRSTPSRSRGNSRTETPDPGRTWMETSTKSNLGLQPLQFSPSPTVLGKLTTTSESTFERKLNNGLLASQTKYQQSLFISSTQPPPSSPYPIQASVYASSIFSSSDTPTATAAHDCNTDDALLPAHFRTLVKILQGYCARGIDRPFRPAVAAEVLTEDRTIFDVLPPDKDKTFLNYAQMAANHGIVYVGGDGGDAWISLRRRYQDIVLDG